MTPLDWSYFQKMKKKHKKKSITLIRHKEK
jgi:hypothetical protein